jgi:hypothetical protein
MSANCLVAVEAALDHYDDDLESAKVVIEGITEYFSSRSVGATRFNEQLLESILYRISSDPKYSQISDKLLSVFC